MTVFFSRASLLAAQLILVTKFSETGVRKITNTGSRKPFRGPFTYYKRRVNVPLNTKSNFSPILTVGKIVFVGSVGFIGSSDITNLYAIGSDGIIKFYAIDDESCGVTGSDRAIG